MQLLSRQNNDAHRLSAGRRSSGNTLLTVLLALTVAVLGGVNLLMFSMNKASERNLAQAESRTRQLEKMRGEHVEKMRNQIEAAKNLGDEREALASQAKSLKQKVTKLEAEVASKETANNRLITEIAKLKIDLADAQSRASNEPRAALAPPPAKRKPTPAEVCINQLDAIQRAKRQWAMHHNKSETDVPVSADIYGIIKYIKHERFCPEGGTYKLNALGENATCSTPGHGL